VSSIRALYSSQMARRCCWCASKAGRARRTLRLPAARMAPRIGESTPRLR
jgi:hypothetical protein